MASNEPAKLSRRRFLGAAGLGAASVGAGRLLLRSDARPTESVGSLEDSEVLEARILARSEISPPTDWKPTEDNALGPFYLEGSPFRAKITPPFEPGKTLVVSGRVWSIQTREPISGAVLDIWQANAEGRYDMDGSKHPSGNREFKYRARLLTDETGRYEFETVYPGNYELRPGNWRTAHIHYLISHPGHKTLVTQLYFTRDPRNESDGLFKPSLAIDLEGVEQENGSYERGVFDIVLEPARA